MSLRRLLKAATTDCKPAQTKTRAARWLPIGVLGALAWLPMTSQAGTSFSYQDWQVACDNTLTCRIAGYQSEKNSDMPVSVLLTRRAGKGALTTGKLKLGGTKDSSAKALMKLGNRHRITMRINGKDLGETRPVSNESGDSELTRAQVDALVEALGTSSTIEFVFRNSRWQLSDKGATAVMLKADDVQGRVGTSGALVNPNAAAGNQGVLDPRAAPILNKVLPNEKNDARKFRIRASQLASIVKGATKNAADTCPSLNDDSAWRISRLNDSQLLVQHSCWLAAYNAGTGMWVMNDSKPYKPTLVTTDATDYHAGVIRAEQKGRGIGDCYSIDEWVWTGARFEKSREATTGMCRLIEAGGAWQMPTFVTDIKG
ncbi:DUF1176 domain-containing protein [Psychrobacter aestuarii]|uniref:DUF1176 domain-containing protein n=1 Tax=Psychrobacter aestuarii TaxID=556327 RepID=A0ABN0VQB6_9GAMM|nr:DUF1176 domain-containing protein [Psychrobacter aestuarii]